MCQGNQKQPTAYLVDLNTLTYGIYVEQVEAIVDERVSIFWMFVTEHFCGNHDSLRQKVIRYRSHKNTV